VPKEWGNVIEKIDAVKIREYNIAIEKMRIMEASAMDAYSFEQ
jgi:hypothetical protein